MNEIVSNLIKYRYKSHKNFCNYLNRKYPSHSFRDKNRFSAWINGECRFSDTKEAIIYNELGLSFKTLWPLLTRFNIES